MTELKINNLTVTVENGTTIFEAAKSIGVDIPVMCHNGELEHFTSCMVCMVKDLKTGKLLPACSHSALDGMDISTVDDEAIEARKMSLELLLSEHVGDCEAPCTMACPAHMDIPLMNRLLAAGKIYEAAAVVKNDIALPAILGRICPAPCEGVCRRKSIDQTLGICLLKQFAGDFLLKEKQMEAKPSNGKSVAIIGSGPSGLAAASHLVTRGYVVEVFEKNGNPGGILLTDFTSEQLPKSILNGEINSVLSYGVKLHLETLVDAALFSELNKTFDAVIIATGANSIEASGWQEVRAHNGFFVDSNTFQFGTTKIFAIGNAVKKTKLVIRMIAQGKEVAFSVDQFLSGQQVVGELVPFNSKFGKLKQEEVGDYLMEAVAHECKTPQAGKIEGFSFEEVKAEAGRCLHCDCRKPEDCKLRLLAGEYQVRQVVNKDTRHLVTKNISHPLIIFEPTKCIKCGVCVRLTRDKAEAYGFTFLGRGYNVEIGIPLGHTITDGVRNSARQVAEACPTGAIALKMEV